MSKITHKAKLRFFSKVREDRDCHIWIGAKRGNRGYGAFFLGGEIYAAHRVAFALEYPEHEDTMLTKRTIVGIRGDYVLHSCDRPYCVNPLHLRMGSAQDNSQDMLSRGRSLRGRPKAKKENPGAEK